MSSAPGENGDRASDPSRDLAVRIAETATKLGFADCGIAAPDAIADAGARLRDWLAAERQGEMRWMADRLDWRADPRTLWPSVRSVIMLAEDYAPGSEADPLALLDQPDRATISVYARGKDYHDIVKRRLKTLGRWLVAETGCEIKVFVDTAPVMEKPLAEAAGLGWRGKHTNLVSRRLGSWFFLGAIFTTLDLPTAAGHVDRCGGCRRCLDICPTAAFPAPYQLDARRCISYLTIELKGPIPREMRTAIGNRIYGCDDCLAVCPWNKFARRAGAAAYWARTELAAPRLRDLADLDDAAFRAVFAGSPIKRIGRDRLLRNVLVAIGNSGDATHCDVVAERLRDASPLVRGAAVWAYARLAEPEALARAAADAETEEFDESVRDEWRAATRTATARS